MIELNVFKKLMEENDDRLSLLTLDEFFERNTEEDSIAPNDCGYENEKEILPRQLSTISEALLSLDSSDASDVMAYPDDLKLRSSKTLFAKAASEEKGFQQGLDLFFGGEKD